MSSYDGPIFDGDSHIFEKDFGFFKQYLPKKYHERWLPARKVGRDGYGFYVGDQLVANFEIDPSGLVPPPGKLKEWLRAVKAGESNVSGWINPTPDMYDRDARLQKLDEFASRPAFYLSARSTPRLGISARMRPAMRFCTLITNGCMTLGVLPTKSASIPPAALTLWDTPSSIAEAERHIKRGVRIVVVPIGTHRVNGSPIRTSIPSGRGSTRPGVIVSFHLSEAAFMDPLIRASGEKPLQQRRLGQTAWQWMFCYSEVPVQMTLANIVYHNFFARFPNIKIASVENGAAWLPNFLVKMDKMRGMAKNGYWPCGQLKERPSAIFKEHCYVVAYPEDPVKEMIERIGSSKCLLNGSDYPHAEGVPTPRDFTTEALKDVAPADVRAIMYDNGRRLLPKVA